MSTDATERRELGSAAGTAETERLFELANDLLAVADADGYFTRLNPAWEKTFGWTRAELMARPYLDFVHPDDRARTMAASTMPASGVREVRNHENRYRCKSGEWRWLLWSAHAEAGVWYAVAKDVTERKQLERQALHDSLTGLPNRLVFMDRLEHALQRLSRRDGIVAVIFVDLDHLKVVNDSLGHDVGNELLVQAAERMRASVRNTDTVARVGGDEFVILADEVTGTGDALMLAERVVEACSAPFTIHGERVLVTASAGVSLASDQARTSETMVREADRAMYRAKSLGRGRAQLFDEDLRREVEARLRIEAELRAALTHENELRLVYQPLVSLRDGTIAGCEALLRWQHPVDGQLAPLSFLPLAEETGLIVDIGAQVLETACRQARDWRDRGYPLTIAVNVSLRQLARDDFPNMVRVLLQETGLPAPSLCLEITETAVLERPEHVAPQLEALRRLGVRIALDDFGKGFSSLSHVRALPVDVIKIDRSFVAGIDSGSAERAVVAAILTLSAELGLTVIAEGIERETELAELRRLGCLYGQGFLFSPPRPAADLTLGGFSPQARPGLGDPYVIREFMRQIGIPARIQ
jgi:diguanylate cyclase (GGDEF)-like protein/PAS domain S-box-containing protein